MGIAGSYSGQILIVEHGSSHDANHVFASCTLAPLVHALAIKARFFACGIAPCQPARRPACLCSNPLELGLLMSDWRHRHHELT